MHALFDNLKNFTFEELEKRHKEIQKRMQMYTVSNMQNQVIWDQLMQMSTAIQSEKLERVSQLSKQEQSHMDPVVINTDPLEEEKVDTKKKPKQEFSPIS